MESCACFRNTLTLYADDRVFFTSKWLNIVFSVLFRGPVKDNKWPCSDWAYIAGFGSQRTFQSKSQCFGIRVTLLELWDPLEFRLEPFSKRAAGCQSNKAVYEVGTCSIYLGTSTSYTYGDVRKDVAEDSGHWLFCQVEMNPLELSSVHSAF